MDLYHPPGTGRISVYHPEILTNQANPLENELIIRKILVIFEDIITIEHLKSIRCLSKLWNSVSLKLWRQKCTLTIVSRKHLGDSLSRSSLSIEHFMSRISDDSFSYLEETPFVNYRLVGFDFSSTAPSYLHIAQTHSDDGLSFWSYLNNIKTNLVKVEFKSCMFSENGFVAIVMLTLGKVVRVISFVGCYEVPVKSSGTILVDYHTKNIACYFTTLHISGTFPYDQQRFFRECCNLEEVVVRNNYDMKTHSIRMLVLERKSSQNKKTIRKIDVLESRYMSGLHGVGLMQVHFPNIAMSLDFLSLTLETYSPNRRPSDFNSRSTNDLQYILLPLLTMFVQSLKHLRLFRAPIHERMFAREGILQLFPMQMRKLEELYLFGNIVEHFGFLNKTPKLKVLKIENLCYSMMSHLENLYVPNRTKEQYDWVRSKFVFRKCGFTHIISSIPAKKLVALNHMHTLHLDIWVNSGIIELLGTAMSNLRVFAGILNPASWKSLCVFMHNIRELNILYGSTIGDVEISGYLVKGTYQIDNLERQGWNITCFRHLDKFVYKSSCGKNRLHDISAKHGFSELCSLNTVVLFVDANFSLDAEFLLRRQIANVFITRKDENNCLGKFDCCKRTRFLETFVPEISSQFV